MSVSALSLERPGWWRTAGLSAIILTALLPAVPLVAEFVKTGGRLDALQGFIPILAKSLALNLAGGTVALVIGICLGLMHSFYSFSGAKIIRMLFLTPLCMPPLLLAQGIRYFEIKFLTGPAGMVYVTAIVTLPLVMLATITASSLLSSGQCLAARLAGGERCLLRYAARFVFPSALTTALMGTCIMLSCPGPAMALGVKVAISEILISFSALYDLNLAASQCLLMSGAALLTLLTALAISGKQPLQNLSVSTGSNQPRYHPQMSRLAFISSLAVLVLQLGVPATGLIVPAISVPDVAEIMNVISRTGANSLVYATGTASAATLSGTAAAFFMNKSARHRYFGTVSMLLIFSLPATLTALGFSAAGTISPPWADFIFRSRAAVCLSQGLRLFPIPALLVLRALNSVPSSWAWAAEMQGISLGRYIAKIIIPVISGPVMAGFLVTALFSQADISTLLLLHPPGSQNLPLAILTIMANAPRALIAQLDLIYMALAIVLLMVTGHFRRGMNT